VYNNNNYYTLVFYRNCVRFKANVYSDDRLRDYHVADLWGPGISPGVLLPRSRGWMINNSTEFSYDSGSDFISQATP